MCFGVNSLLGDNLRSGVLISQIRLRPIGCPLLLVAPSILLVKNKNIMDFALGTSCLQQGYTFTRDTIDSSVPIKHVTPVYKKVLRQYNFVLAGKSPNRRSWGWANLEPCAGDTTGCWSIPELWRCWTMAISDILIILLQLAWYPGYCNFSANIKLILKRWLNGEREGLAKVHLRILLYNCNRVFRDLEQALDSRNRLPKRARMATKCVLRLAQGVLTLSLG
jgi:hypothetical protein